MTFFCTSYSVWSVHHDHNLIQIGKMAGNKILLLDMLKNNNQLKFIHLKFLYLSEIVDADFNFIQAFKKV